MWVGEEQCSKIIEDVGASNGRQWSMAKVMSLISWCGAKLKHWNRNSFGNVQKCLAEANQKLKSAQDKHLVDLNSIKLNVARKEVQVWLELDELM